MATPVPPPTPAAAASSSPAPPPEARGPHSAAAPAWLAWLALGTVYVVLGEAIAATTLLGAAVVLTAVWFIVRSTRPPPPTSRPAPAATGAGTPDAAVASIHRPV